MEDGKRKPVEGREEVGAGGGGGKEEGGQGGVGGGGGTLARGVIYYILTIYIHVNYIYLHIYKSFCMLASE